MGGSGFAAEGLVGSFWNSAPTGREPENRAPVGRFLPSKNEVETGRDDDDVDDVDDVTLVVFAEDVDADSALDA